MLTTVEINLATICFFELKGERQKMGFVSLERNVKGGEERREAKRGLGFRNFLFIF